MAYPQQGPSHDPKKQSPFNNYIRFSGLAIQILATLGVCGWIGFELDRYLELSFPAFMLTFGFVGFAGIMFQLYRALKNQ